MYMLSYSWKIVLLLKKNMWNSYRTKKNQKEKQNIPTLPDPAVFPPLPLGFAWTNSIHKKNRPEISVNNTLSHTAEKAIIMLKHCSFTLNCLMQNLSWLGSHSLFLTAAVFLPSFLLEDWLEVAFPSLVSSVSVLSALHLRLTASSCCSGLLFFIVLASKDPDCLHTREKSSMYNFWIGCLWQSLLTFG